MSISSENTSKEFLHFFKAGKEAARQGNKTEAHQLFRRAIEENPYHEQVWLWLASVVETEEDRRVCFENVLELNPLNPTARQQLRKLEARELAEANRPSQPVVSEPRKRARWKRALLVLLFLLIVGGGIAAVIFALGLV